MLRSASFPFRTAIFLLCAAHFLFTSQSEAQAGSVVLNEIYYDPPEKAKASRFIELFNPTEAAVDLSHWRLAGEVEFAFPDGTSIEAKAYLVVAQNPDVFAEEFQGKAVGPYKGELHRRGAKIELHDGHDAIVDQVTYGAGWPWPTAAGGMGSSLELINPQMPRDNPASWRSSGFPATRDPAAPETKVDKTKLKPTPGAANSDFAEHAPPLIDQVAHMPLQPHEGQALTVGARVRAASGLRAVTLEYQIVEPGSYIRRTDPEYANGWKSVLMNDEGRDGDARAGDALFTAALPASLSVHRRLIRYRINAEDSAGAKVRVPYDDDGSSNFAVFVYNGAPAWTGSVEPGKTPPLTFPASLMQTLPALTLIANEEDIKHSQWDGGANKAKYAGTIIADGHVYDNIIFHNRGQASTYVAGKNKWGFKFDRGHDYDARDMWGHKFAHDWDSMPMNACASPWVQSNRGMAGLDEAVSFRIYELAGDPSPRTRPVQYRIIDRAKEAAENNQFEGDLWGLYLEVEDPDGGFLTTRHLPEGNVYRIAGNQGDRKHQSPTQASDVSDWNQFRDASQKDQSEQWWRDHLDLPAFYAFHAVNRLVGNVDLREDANHYFYHRPDDHWTVIPWDLDMMFIPKGHQSGRIDQDRCLEIPALRREYKNRCRELLDLLCSDPSPRGGQIGQVVDEYAAVVHPAGFKLAWPELDECLWNFHPRTSDKGVFYKNPMPGGPDNNWTRTLATPDFFGFAKFITDYCSDTRPGSKWQHDDGDPRGYGFGYLRDEGKDADAPLRPMIMSNGSAGFPINDLLFQCSAYTSPKGADSFAALQWRIGQIAAPAIPGYVAGQPWKYEIEEVWTSPELAEFHNRVQIPASAVHVGATYRARVRMKDTEGRWSRWSEAVEFVVSGARTAGK